MEPRSVSHHGLGPRINVDLVRGTSSHHDSRMLTRSIFSRSGGSVAVWLCAVSLSMAVTTVAFAQDIARTFRKGPYLQAPGSNTMTIMWESPANRPGIVHYGRTGKLDGSCRLERPRELI